MSSREKYERKTLERNKLMAGVHWTEEQPKGSYAPSYAHIKVKKNVKGEIF